MQQTNVNEIMISAAFQISTAGLTNNNEFPEIRFLQNEPQTPGRSREILSMDIHGEFSCEHAKAVGGPYAGYGPAPIRDLDPQKLKIERKSHWTLPEGSVAVLNCIVRLLLT